MKTVSVRVGEKGQITVPVDVRQREKLEKGTQVEVIDLGDGLIFLNKIDRKKEFLLALRILGKRIKEKDYNKDRLISFCRQIRRDVYNA